MATDSVSPTGGWQSFETHDLGQIVISEAGTYTVRVDVTGRFFNLNWLEFNLGDDEVTTPTPTPQELLGAEQLDGQSVEFFVNTDAWADVHYSVNGGGQQNVRMTLTGDRNSYVIDGLASGDQISYWFTYLNPETNAAFDSAVSTLTVQQQFVSDASSDLIRTCQI